jgi:cell division protein FtsN
MRNKETGEFELVVGNGQLVSGFFIVILLFAVGVAMGYILGQNSEKSAKSQQGDAAPCTAADTRPQPSPPNQQAAATQPAATNSGEGQPAAGSTDPPTPTTQPAKEPEPAAPTPPAKTEPVKTAPPPPPAPNPVVSDAPSGFFWQVTAKANQESARATVKALQERGFPAYLAPGPNNLTRVLVGPYKDTPSKAKAKTDLEAMGFKPFPLTRE